ncbi:MAG: extracellular solute-binding protein family 1, partial [Frondihabitans sp.]|nr:extracellular solute-binding protein family 1 [Frondihabitans sp.]
FWPVVNGVTALPKLSAFPTSYQRIDPAFWGGQESQIVTWFDNSIK